MIEFEVLDRFKANCQEHDLEIGEVDNDRPWGGEFVFDRSQLNKFCRAFFPKLEVTRYNGRLAMPKLLFVAPGQQFSWQYHDKRGELWNVIEGPIGLLQSPTDDQPAIRILHAGDNVELAPLTRHRLVGQDKWGVVAELWLHTDLKDQSAETDIVRVADDYGRR